MGETMIRSQLVSELARRLFLRERHALDYVNTLVGAMTDSLVEGNRIELRRFGTFYIRMREERLGRNPLSGTQVQIPRRYTVLFRAGKRLREEVDFQHSAETSGHAE